MEAQLCWLGLGNMGRGMCKNLVEKGSLSKPLIIYNRTSQRATDLSNKLPKGRSTVAETIEDAVSKSDIIFTCVGDDKAMEATIDTAKTVDIKGKLFVDCSTIHPDTTDKLAKIIEGAGAEFVACPVFGAPAMAEAGQLICVIAGPSTAVEKMRPYTKGVMARENIEHADQPQRQATLLKIIGNSFILNMVEMLGEGHVVAEQSGLGVENLQQFIKAMFPAPYMAYSQRMNTGDYYNRESPLFAVDLALKDAGHMLDIAKTHGAKMKAIEVAQGHLQEVKKVKGERGDLAGIYGAVREESGMKFDS